MDILEQQYVCSAVEEMSHLNGEQFESLCKDVMSIIVREEIIDKGLNLYMKPVGYTGDLILDAQTVGQCGTEPKYFSDQTKPLGDVESCLKNHPRCSCVYLFGNQRAKGTEYTDLESVLKTKYPLITIVIYDSEKLAKVLYDNVLHRKTKNALGYLPRTKFYNDICECSHNLPVVCESYVERSEEKLVMEKLKATAFIQIYGISGIGKSSLVCSVARKMNDEFEAILWVDGTDLKDNQALDSVVVGRRDQKINLSTILRTMRVLIIVDNLNDNVKRLKSCFNDCNLKDSRCVVTSLQRNVSEQNAFLLTYADETVTRKMLTSGIHKPTNEQIETLIPRVHGYPLILVLAKSAVDEGEYTWDELINDSNISDLADTERNQTIAKRIIGRYVESCGKLFNLIGKMNSLQQSATLLRESYMHEFNRAIKASLICWYSPEYVRIHDLVRSSICSLIGFNWDEHAVRDALSEFLMRHLDKRDAALYAFVFSYKEWLQRAREFCAEDEPLFHLCVYASVMCLDSFEDSASSIKEIKMCRLDEKHSMVDLRIHIELKELELRSTEEYNNCELSQESVRQYTQAIEEAEVLKKFWGSKEAKSIVAHHQGKWSKKIKQEDMAESFYKESIGYNGEAFNSRMQLARMYMREDIDKATEQITYIMERRNEVPLSTLLSVYELLNNPKVYELRKKYIYANSENFKNDFSATVSGYNTHGYSFLATMGFGISYLNPNLFMDLFCCLPEPINGNKKNYGYYAIILAALYQYGIMPDKERVQVADKADFYFQNGSFQGDLHNRRALDFYVLLGNREKAQYYSTMIKNTEDVFYLHSMAKYYLLADDDEKALEIIQKSIEIPVEEAYKAAFMHTKASILHHSNNDDCIACLCEAIKLQPEEKSKSDWKQELNAWCQEYGVSCTDL